MKLLFITNNYLTSNGGASFASRAFINACAEIADEMTLCYPVNRTENLFGSINKKVKVVPFSYNKPKFLKLLDLLVGRVHRYYSLRGDKKTLAYDVVVFDTSVVSYKLIDFYSSFGLKCVVIHHNYQYEYFRDNVKGLLKYPVLFWCKKYEKRAVHKADLNLVLTEQDLTLLQKNYDKRHIAKYGVLGTFEEINNATDYVKEGNYKARFIITGSLDSVQTEESLIPWIRIYYPLLKENCPNCTLVIAGKKPSMKIKEICQMNNITLVESPKDIISLIQNSDVYICPTKLGGGLKLRIMDGLKCGLPVITHEVSARGYDIFKEKEMLYAYNDKKSFVSALQKVLRFKHSKREIAEEYKSYFSFENGSMRLRTFLECL